jgi:hypothetical protein
MDLDVALTWFFLLDKDDEIKSALFDDLEEYLSVMPILLQGKPVESCEHQVIDVDFLFMLHSIRAERQSF